MAMRIERGKRNAAQKVVIYGCEGVGKTLFAARFPEPVFLDLEDGTRQYDVARARPETWQELLDCVAQLSRDDECKTIVVDTADKAEAMCTESICKKRGWSGIEDAGYGKGYIYLAEEFAHLLGALDLAVKSGKHVVVCAHAQMRKFEQPDEAGSYDRWELKLGKKTSPLLKEWADALLFANYRTIVESVGEGMAKKVKARGAKRVMYVNHHACWDAKNRWGIDDDCLPLDYDRIREFVEVDIPKPKTLAEMMAESGIKPEMLELYSAQVGNVAEGTKLEDFPQAYLDFIRANWDAIAEKCKNEVVPF